MRLPLKVLSFLATSLAVLAAALVVSSWPTAIAPPAVSSSPAPCFMVRPAGGAGENVVVALGPIEPVSRVLRLAGLTGNDADRVVELAVAEGQRGRPHAA